ncbi:MAG: Crp/Fnr family transcriptional regulator [Rhodoferax sp.]
MSKRLSAELHQSRERAAAVLARCELAQACAPETRQAILRSARIDHHANREPIHRVAQPMTDLVLVLDGILEVSHTSPTGRRHVNAYLPAGNVFGLIPLIDGKGCTHDTWARGPLTLMRIPKEVMLQAMATDPVFLQAVMGDLCDRSRIMATQLSKRALLPLRALTAWTLLDLAGRHGFQRDRLRMLNLRLSQDGLADLLGVTRQSTNRELKRLEREGIIRVCVSEIELLDTERLGEVAAECH